MEKETLLGIIEMVCSQGYSKGDNFITNGGTIVTKIPNPKSCIAPTHAKSIEDKTKNRFRLPALSPLYMVYSESQGTDMLFPLDESGELDAIVKDIYKHVRWDFSSEQA